MTVAGTPSWLDDYRRMIGDRSVDFHAVVRLKNAHFPKALFRYYAVNDYNLDAFTRDYVWMSPPEKFNDLYDAATLVDLPFSVRPERLEKLREFLRQEPSNRFTEAQIDEFLRADSPIEAIIDALVPSDDRAKREALIGVMNGMRDEVNRLASQATAERFRKQLFVTCFSEHGDSPTMWAHYADDNQGFALEFSPADLPADDLRARLLLPVLYGDAPFDGTARVIASQEAPNSFAIMWPLLAATHKDGAWAYEREWRLINPEGYFFHPGAADGASMPMPRARRLLLGARIGADDAAKLIAIAKAKGIPIAKMKPGRTAAVLDVETLATDGA